MVVVTTAPGLPFGRPLTVADLELLPDDGHRYELIDGTLIVSPAPAWEHQEVQAALLGWLRQHCPSGLRALAAPFEVQLAMDTAVQPDLFVARFADMRRKNLPVSPLLAVEVRSPSTVLIDRNLKRATYERFGIPSYWLVHPDSEEPSVTVLELVSGCYVERATVVGKQPYAVERPFPVTIVPADLVRGLHPD
jgi:Uma2 family endonuclease